MKKSLKILSIILILCVFLIAIDFMSIFYGNKPILVIDKESNSLGDVYHGLFFDTYDCISYSSYQIKFKWIKFSCPDVIKENVENLNNTEKEAKLTLVGDLLFEQPFYDAVSNGYDKNEYFSLVRDYFINDDLSIGNMEVVIGNSSLQTSGAGYNFCAPEYIGHLVNTLDFEVLGTANNHAYDRSTAGLYSTLDFFKNNTNIMTIGTYKNKEDRENLRILNINDIKFGFLAYTYGTNQKAIDEDANLIGYYKNPETKKIDMTYKNVLKEEISRLKKKADVVVVLMHWGNEFTYSPNSEQKEMAKYLNELGVDIIVGSHSHSVQPIDVIGDEHQTLVYYSLGNFVSHDDDIARTKEGEEEFDNAYQVGLLSTLNVVVDNNEISFENIKAELTVNYFDNEMRNFKIVPFNNYNEYEKTHHRYNKGLTIDFINKIYDKVIDKDYHI